MWYVVVLIWVVLVAGVVWTYRQKQRQRSSERAKQVDALLSELKVNRSQPAVAPAAAAPPVPELSRKPRLLSQAGALLYYVFKTGLPDHEIFAGLALSELVDIAASVSGYEREQKLRRLAQQRLDLVVCTKQLEVVAAVVLGNAADGVHSENTRFTEACLHTAGIRLVRVDPAAPPRHQQVRALIYGAESNSA